MERDVNDMREIGVTPVEKISNTTASAFLKADRRHAATPPIAESSASTSWRSRPARRCSRAAGIQHYNPIGAVHGGFAMTLLELLPGVPIHTTLAKGELYTTLEIEGEPRARDHQGHGHDPRDRAPDPSRPHHRDRGRRHPRRRGQPARPRHHDVHDFPGEEVTGSGHSGADCASENLFVTPRDLGLRLSIGSMPRYRRARAPPPARRRQRRGGDRRSAQRPASRAGALLRAGSRCAVTEPVASGASDGAEACSVSRPRA